MPHPHDIRIWRGANAPPVIFHLPFDIAGSIFVLTANWRGGSLTRSSDDGGLVLDLAAATVTWPYTAEDSLHIPVGRVTRYTFERRVPAGEERIYAFGFIIGCGGDNND